jgi:XTP/dITP diphosphohydrolase
MELLFATGNPDKFSEASSILSDAGVVLKQHVFRHREIRSDSLEEIARDAVGAAYSQCGAPVFVEDSGFFVTALNDFPGAYSAWALGKVGLDGMLRLMEGVEDRRARFEACIAFHDGKEVHAFHGACQGSVAAEKRGEGGFGYDPIFVPEGHEQTFAESVTLKNRLSHRYKTLLEFSRFIQSRYSDE